MTDDVRDSYDAMAERYAALFLGDLDRDTKAQDWLFSFASLAANRRGVVADLGCGPGRVRAVPCALLPARWVPTWVPTVFGSARSLGATGLDPCGDASDAGRREIGHALRRCCLRFVVDADGKGTGRGHL